MMGVVWEVRVGESARECGYLESQRGKPSPHLAREVRRVMGQRQRNARKEKKAMSSEGLREEGVRFLGIER